MNQPSASELLHLSAPTFPDLDLWTSLAFQSDEPLIQKDHDRDVQKAINRSQMHELNTSAVADVSTRSTVWPTQSSNNDFDLAAFMATFADPSQLAASAPAPFSSEPHTVPSMRHSISGPPSGSRAKRSRTRSVSSPLTEEPLANPSPDDTAATIEDKRRRNTMASARFRMKKKEKETALEQRAKELEVRVSALEKECEGLRRENGWLKGLVVGASAKKRTSDDEQTK